MAIGISISGRTEEVMECLKQAHRQGAYTVLLTANDRPEYSEFCEEVVCLAAKKNLDFGNIISPQCDDGYFIRILSGDRFICQTGTA